METKIKNQNLKVTIEQLDKMLSEKITLGTKNRIQKVINLLTPHYTDYYKSHIELLKKHGAEEKEGMLDLPKPYTEEFIKEFTELNEQDNTVIFDPIDFTKIENIESEVFYNIELLKKFFENVK